MPIIRQGGLFGVQDLFDMEPPQRFKAIFSTLDLAPILHMISKKSLYGAPTELHYEAMLYSLAARIIERIPTVKDLWRRLQHDLIFRMECGFLFSDPIPSEASYSRLIQKISETTILERVQDTFLFQAIQEGFVEDEVVAIDVTHFKSRDHGQAQEKKSKPTPKKRGRKSKAKKGADEKRKQEEESQKSLYEKTIAAQLDVSLEELCSQVPLQPQWGIKKNSEGKNIFWYGYKAHLAVGTKSQSILRAMMSSGNMNDGKAAIPLLKGIQSILPHRVRYALMDAGDDYLPIYQQIHRMNAQAIMAYNKRNERKINGLDEHFAPTCVREHSYRYDSYDKKYTTLKYVRPKECRDCPLAHDSLCQKVYKMKVDADLRKYTAPARGTQAWEKLYDQRTAVERVNAYVKQFFQLNNVRYRTGKKAKVHFDWVMLIYNASKLAVDRIRKAFNESIAAA